MVRCIGAKFDEMHVIRDSGSKMVSEVKVDLHTHRSDFFCRPHLKHPNFVRPTQP